MTGNLKLIVSNLPEINCGNSESLSDLSQLTDLFYDTGLNHQIIKDHRLGKPT